MSPSPTPGSGILGDIFNFLGAGRAGNAVNDTAIAAEHGVLNAGQQGYNDIGARLGINSGAMIDAQNQATGNVQQFNNYGQNVLGGGLGQSQGNTSPFIQQGQAGVNALGAYVQQHPQFDPQQYSPQQGQYQAAVGNLGNFASQQAQNPFKFNPTMQQLEQTPGYQFAKQEGLNSIQNQNSASGLGNSSNQNLDAAKFATGLAAQTYQQQFNNALSTYGMNQQAGLANNSAVANAAGGLYNSAFNNGLNAFGQNQDVTQRSLGMLTNAGLQGSGQANSALLGFDVPAAQMDFNTGLFGGQAALGTAQFNAQQGLQGNEFQSNILSQQANQAGGFALEGAGANAQGILAQYNNLAGAGSSLLGMFMPGAGIVP